MDCNSIHNIIHFKNTTRMLGFVLLYSSNFGIVSLHLNNSMPLSYAAVYIHAQPRNLIYAVPVPKAPSVMVEQGALNLDGFTNSGSGLLSLPQRISVSSPSSYSG